MPVRPEKTVKFDLNPIEFATTSSYAENPKAESAEPAAQADAGDEGGREEYPEQVRPGPYTPTKAEREQHCATGHAIFRSWCTPCVMGRGRADPHVTVDHGEEHIPVLSWDYGFLNSKSDTDSSSPEPTEGEESGQNPVLVMRDRKSQAPAWYLLPRKGTDFSSFGNFLNMVCEDLDLLGYRRVTFRSDGEASICAVLNEIRAKWTGEVIGDNSAEGDSSSNGNAECGVGHMKGHVRSVKLELESKLGLIIPESHCLLSWIVICQ